MPITRRTRGPGKHGYLRGCRYPPEYRIWVCMIQRCYNPRCREYRYYGGRGIRVCDRWLEAQGFPNFLADLGHQPHPRASIRRVINDGNYAPGNVIWADARTQRRHTRSNRVLNHDGRSMVLTDWAAFVGMKPITLTQRLRGTAPAG